MRLPTWDELIGKQRDVLEHPLDQPLFVAGPPGSGKTVLAVQRAALVSGGDESVVLVTYNRMLRRLAALLSGDTAMTKTMHGFAYHDYRNRTARNPPTKRNSYDYDWAGMLATLNEDEHSEPTWHHVVVDEAQDLPKGFFRYLHEHVSNVLSVFADEDQAIGDRSTSLTEIRTAAELPEVVLLHENHRNVPEIAAVAEYFHTGGLPAATPTRAPIGQLPRLIQKKNLEDTAEFIATWIENRGGTVGVVVYSNSTGSAVYEAMKRRLPGRRVDIYVHDSKDEDTIGLLDEGITILNVKSVKGQEFDTAFVLQLERFLPCVNDTERRAMYMMCARGRDYLFLVYRTAGLSAGAIADLPGPEVLERG